MTRPPMLRSYAIAAIAALLAALIAALVAHVAIDVAGDFVLARDAYDGIAHHSRLDAAVVALIGGCAALAGILRRALAQARGGRGSPPPTAREVGLDSAWRFAGFVVVASLALLVSMESIDLALDGVRIDDAADLLGGSVWLGLTVTIGVAVAAALAVRAGALRILAAGPRLAACFGRIIALLSRTRCSRRSCLTRPPSGAWVVRRIILARRAAKRGPPLPA